MPLYVCPPDTVLGLCARVINHPCPGIYWWGNCCQPISCPFCQTLPFIKLSLPLFFFVFVSFVCIKSLLYIESLSSSGPSCRGKFLTWLQYCRSPLHAFNFLKILNPVRIKMKRWFWFWTYWNVGPDPPQNGKSISDPCWNKQKIDSRHNFWTQYSLICSA